MLVPKAHRLAIYRYLFNEGVVVAKKDFRGRMHEDIKLEGATETLPNLQVAMLMKSMTSRGYTKESFSWQFYYWYLTNEGIEYLREYLHLPAEVMPNTLKKQAVRAPSRPSGDAYGDKKGGFGAPDGYRPSYGGEKGKGGGKGGAGRGGGFGRGGGDPRGQGP